MTSLGSKTVLPNHHMTLFSPPRILENCIPIVLTQFRHLRWYRHGTYYGSVDGDEVRAATEAEH